MPLPLPAVGPAREQQRGMALTGQARVLVLHAGTANRLFRQVARAGVSQAGFDRAMAELGDQLPDVTGAGWLASRDGEVPLLVRGPQVNAALQRVEQTSDGPLYTYRVGLALMATAGDRLGLPPSASSPENAFRKVTVQPEEAWQQGYPLPDETGGEAAGAVQMGPPPGKPLLSLGVLGSGPIVEASGRRQLVQGVLDVVGQLRRGLLPASLPGPVQPSQGGNLGTVLHTFSDMPAVAEQALSGPLTFTLDDTSGLGLGSVEVEVTAAANYPLEEGRDSALDFPYAGSVTVDGTVYHKYRASVVHYAITARSVRLTGPGRKIALSDRLTEQSLPPPPRAQSAEAVVGTIAVPGGAVWAAHESDRVADTAQPPPPGELSGIWLTSPKDESWRPANSYNLRDYLSPDDIARLKVDDAYTENDMDAIRVVLAKKIYFDPALVGTEPALYLNAPPDPRPGLGLLGRTRASWTSLGITDPQHRTYSAPLFALTQPGTRTARALRQAVNLPGRRRLLVAAHTGPARLPVPGEPGGLLPRLAGMVQVETEFSNLEIISTPRPGPGGRLWGWTRSDSFTRYSGGPAIGPFSASPAAVIVTKPYGVRKRMPLAAAKAIRAAHEVVRPRTRFPTMPMKETARGEHLPRNNPFWPSQDPPRLGRYLGAVEREKFRVRIPNGLIYDANGQLFNSQPGLNGWAPFVMTGERRFYTSNDLRLHSAFLAGAGLAAAGLWRVENGRVLAPLGR